MNNYKVVIIHGAYGSPEENWFPWLKQELQALGHHVIVPQFPTPEGQHIDKWLEILDKEIGNYDEDLLMVGHSLGPALILRKLEMLDKPIRASFLVSAFLGKLGLPDFDPINANFFDKPFNWRKIRRNCLEFFIYNSDNDPYDPLEHGHRIAKHLNTSLNILHNAGHINASAGYVKFEKLLDDIKALS